MHQHRLGAVWLESSLVEEDLEVLVDTILTMTSSVPEAAKQTNSILGCIAGRLREVIFPLYIAPVELCLEHSAQFWAPQYEQHGYIGANLA